jgi:hypothetical protein
LTYKGKLIILGPPPGGSGPVSWYYSDDTVDNWVENDIPFDGKALGGAVIGLSEIKNDDGTPVQESQCVLKSEVPTGILYRYVNEPAFYV